MVIKIYRFEDVQNRRCLKIPFCYGHFMIFILSVQSYCYLQVIFIESNNFLGTKCLVNEFCEKKTLTQSTTARSVQFRNPRQEVFTIILGPFYRTMNLIKVEKSMSFFSAHFRIVQAADLLLYQRALDNEL